MAQRLAFTLPGPEFDSLEIIFTRGICTDTLVRGKWK